MTRARRHSMGALREVALPLFLGAMVLIMIAVSLTGARRGLLRAYDARSLAPDGVHALRTWLDELGFTVVATGRDEFALPPEARLFYSFPGERAWSDADAALLRGWVEQGGTAVLVDQAGGALADALLEGASNWKTTHPYSSVRQSQPILPEAASQWNDLYGASVLRSAEASRAVTVTTTVNGDVASAVMRMGDGWVWFLGPAHDLTNQALRDSNQAALATALLRAVPPGALVLFDDYHFFGARDEASAIVSLQDWLWLTAEGRALLFVLLALALFWLLAGRRLGPPLPAQEEVRRREAAEYVRAMASLKRRARALGEIAAHHRTRLKVALARRGPVDAALSDAELVRRLGQAGVLSAMEQQRVAGWLGALAAADNEQAVVRAVAEADAMLSGR